MSKTAKATHNRVAVFQSNEVQIEAAPGEWVRDKRKSSKPIADIINDFLQTHKASVVFVSPPTIELTSMSAIGAEHKVRTYRCAVSVIYSPEEIVHDGTVEEPKSEEEFDLTNVPEEHRETILKTIKSQIAKEPGPASTRYQPPKVKTRAKAKSEEATKAGKAGTCVQPRTNRPDNRLGGSAGIPKRMGSGRASTKPVK